MINNDSIDALEQAAPLSAAASPQHMAVPDGWKLVPVQPTPEIIAGAAIASWPTATLADIDLARQAAPLVLMQMDMAAGTTVDALAGMLATMAPAYRAMLAAAPKYSPLPAAAPQVVADERAAFEKFSREACNIPDGVAVNWKAQWTTQAYEGWLGRAALAAAPVQAQQPVAWMTEDGRVSTDETKRTAMASTSRPVFNIPLFRGPVQAQEPRKPTDISQRLRKWADERAIAAHYGDLMRTAADEIERYYGGMMAWKQTAEKKDADWNAERMARVDERIANRNSAPVQPVAVPDGLAQNNPLAHTWPAEIFLQVGDCDRDAGLSYDDARQGEITWCFESIDKGDVRYVRAAAPAAQGDAKEGLGKQIPPPLRKTLFKLERELTDNPATDSIFEQFGMKITVADVRILAAIAAKAAS